ncbi:hypothetical protein SLH49_13640 [Cognatiyoonia sp. IB215446]|uniref:hypothetical protein n=1 Tax=Cognatiyoonia sp. IB215446 TaxID=3097355 RepID=UPI002A16681E|nr:hypothetical protein [Cognatiyoonia sp. IB215446]MDX8349023.1 hypothetical protein [Cognatiyoonia sp. IB215446]
MFFLAFGAPAMAETITCDLQGTPVNFTIDRTQFAPAHNAGEPPRRKVTMVRMGEAQFPAEPILMGDVRGFWGEGLSGSNVMFVVQPDGSAVFTDMRAGQRLAGQCEIQ